jgi:hypothetical protein
MHVSAMNAAPEHKQRNRQLTLGDLEAIASLIVDCGLTETEAAIHCGFKPKALFDFKFRNKGAAKYQDCIARLRGASLQRIVTSIRAAGTPDADPASRKRSDWRALAWIAEKITAPDRLGQQVQAGPTITNNQILMNCGGEDGLKKLIESYSQGIKTIDPAQPMKRLPNPDTPTGSV